MSKANVPITLLRLFGFAMLVLGVLASSLISADDLLQSFDIKEQIPSILFLLFNFMFKTLLSTIVGLDSMIALSLNYFRSSKSLDTSVTTLDKEIFEELLLLEDSGSSPSAPQSSLRLSIAHLYPQGPSEKVERGKKISPVYPDCRAETRWERLPADRPPAALPSPRPRPLALPPLPGRRA